MEALRQHWLFADLAEEEWQPLAAVAVRQRVPDGQMLFHQGAPTPGLHVVEDGAIKIFTLTPAGEERIIDFVGAGEFCGEMGLVAAAPSSSWGQAVGATQLYIIPPAAFERVLLGQPQIGLRLCRVLVAKLRAQSNQVEEMLFLRARERVLRHLVRLAERHGRAEAAGVRVPLRLTHREIAQLVGTARETVSRVLAELQDGHLLTFQGRHLVFVDLAGVRKLAGLAAG